MFPQTLGRFLSTKTADKSRDKKLKMLAAYLADLISSNFRYLEILNTISKIV
jgi:hypothetical protein